MVQLTTSAQVKELGTIMGIWAHPDDETYMSGGLMAMAVQNGQSVVCVTATRGEAGIYDPLRWPAENIGATRAVELTEALQILGIKHHHWLHYKDGACGNVTDDEAVAQIWPLIQKYRPDTIVTFPPNGLTGHGDHKAVSRWSRVITERSEDKSIRVLYGVDSVTAYNQFFKAMDEKLNIYFNVDQPDLYEKVECDAVLTLTDEIVNKKCEALRVMPSQTAAMLKEFTFDFLCQAFAEECYVFAGNEHS